MPIISGDIQEGFLYEVAGDKSVIYNEITYSSGNLFRGVLDVKDFAFTGSGSEIVEQVSEVAGISLEIVQTPGDANSYNFDDETEIFGFSLQMELNEEEKIVQENTQILGFSLELRDFPFYAFEVSESQW